MTWGLVPWGGAPWGGGAAAVTALRAYPVDRRRVRVCFSGAVRFASELAEGDGANTDTWLVTELTPAGGVELTFQIATATDVVAARTIDLRLIEPLGPATARHSVEFPTLVTPGGAPVAAPTTLYFNGLGLAMAAGRGQHIDLLNAETTGSGGLVATTAGSYEVHSGVELLRKIVLRRLTTPTGAFIHLPRFGIELRAKEPVRSITALQAQVTAQLRQEPEIAAVRVVVARQGELITVSVRARVVATNEVVEVTVGVGE